MTPPKNPEKNLETMKPLNWVVSVISAAQICVSKHAINVQNITELRPSLNETGAKKNPPLARPAEAAEFYNISVKRAVL